MEKLTEIMCNEILYILLPDYAAHEVVYLSQAIASDEFSLKENPKYVNKVVPKFGAGKIHRRLPYCAGLFV